MRKFVTVTKDVTGCVLLEISLMLKFCNYTMIDEDKVCCMCGITKFIECINTGERYYCNVCMKKINDSGMDYWKPCTQVKFFESMLSHMRKGNNRKSTNILTGLKEQFRQFDEDSKDR